MSQRVITLTQIKIGMVQFGRAQQRARLADEGFIEGDEDGGMTDIGTLGGRVTWT